MDFQGKVTQFLGETSGTSKAGNPWKKKEWIVETYGQYSKKIKVTSFGDRSENVNLEPGKDYTFHVDIESREFNGRWYTEVNIFRYEEYNPQGQNSGFSNNTQPVQPTGFVNQPYGNPSEPSFGGDSAFAQSVGESDEDLPF